MKTDNDTLAELEAKHPGAVKVARYVGGSTLGALLHKWSRSEEDTMLFNQRLAYWDHVDERLMFVKDALSANVAES